MRATLALNGLIINAVFSLVDRILGSYPRFFFFSKIEFTFTKLKAKDYIK